MAESQNSNSSSSEKESLVSSDKSIPAGVLHSENKATDTDFASGEDEDFEEPVLAEEQRRTKTCSDTMDQRHMVRPSFQEHGQYSEPRQPKTIKSIVMALKEGKTRENGSPMRGNRPKAGVVSTQKPNIEASPKVIKPTAPVNAVAPGIKANADIPTIVPPKAVTDSTKRILGLHPLKYQV